MNIEKKNVQIKTFASLKVLPFFPSLLVLTAVCTDIGHSNSQQCLGNRAGINYQTFTALAAALNSGRCQRPAGGQCGFGWQLLQ